MATGAHHVDAVVLSWIPLGAPDAAHPLRIHWVRFGGRIFETINAIREGRDRRAIYHAALEVWCDGSRYAIEMTPVWGQPPVDRGVVLEGPVGLRSLGRSRFFRYEVRCWPDGVIPDLAYAVDGPILVSQDRASSRHVLRQLPACPRMVWGRDELGAGEMWNSNSVVSWLLSRSGHQPARIHPPAGGSAPGWTAGLVAADRTRDHQQSTT